jgi:thioredoxin 1
MRNVEDTDFSKHVLAAQKPVLVSFHTSWCKPSKHLAPIVDDVLKHFGTRIESVAVNAEGKTAAICRRYGVDRFPVTMLFDQGRRVDLIGGLASKKELVAMVERRLERVLQVDEFSFDDEVLRSSVPVLVRFGASWCKASQAMLPYLTKASDDFDGQAKVVRVEFGPDTSALCRRYGVTRVPTLVLFVDGEIRDRILGSPVPEGKASASAKGATTTFSAGNSEMLRAFVL